MLQPRADIGEFYCDQILNSSAKIVFVFSKAWYYDFTEFCEKRGILLKETFPKHPKGYATIQNSLLYPVIESVIGRLIPSGILQNIARKSFEPKLGAKSPKVFSIDDLAFGFMIWLAACVMSVVAFLSELVWKFSVLRVKKVLRTSIGLGLFLKLLKTRLTSMENK